MDTVAAPALVLAAPVTPSPVPPAERFHREVCPNPTVNARESSADTASKTTCPAAEVTLTVAEVPAPMALLAVPSGLLWSTPLKVMTPATSTSLSAVPLLTTICN